MPVWLEASFIIQDPVSEVVGNIKCNLDMPLRARPKHHVSSAAKDTVGFEEKVEQSAE